MEENIETNLEETHREGMDWIQVAQDEVHVGEGFCED
jgi:hypothetical protein